MKIIEALKQIKDLERKATDLISKIEKHSADMDYEQPIYQDQRVQIASWIQSQRDIIHEICRLKYCIQKTNVNTNVTIILDGKEITKSITEWIERRRNLAALEKRAWMSLTNRGLKDMKLQQSAGQIVDAKVRYYYDPLQRDKMVDLLSSEPSIINAKLEIVNATTDLME